MLYQRQSGFTLVELMVAMAIGTLVILGAGQLFLTTFQTFKKVDELSRKQEALIFFTSEVGKNIRSAKNINIEQDDVAIVLLIEPQGGYCEEGEDMYKRFFLSGSGDNVSLSLMRRCEDDSQWGQPEPLIDGFYNNSFESFSVKALEGGVYKVRVRLAAEKAENYEEFMLHIQNRAEMVL